MNVKVLNYMNVQQRISYLGCTYPTGLTILPKNFMTARSRYELVYQQSTSEIRALWQRASVIETQIEGECDFFPEVGLKGGEWIAPTLFVGAFLISQNTTLVSIALNVISNYLTDIFKGSLNQKHMEIKIVVEKTKSKTYKCLEFKGTIQEFKDANLDEYIRKIQGDD